MGKSAPRSLEQVLWFSEAMKSRAWKKYRVKDGQKGPVVWEAKRLRVTLKGSDDLPGMRLWLVVARNTLDGELKFFLSNASERTPLSALLLVAFQRWRVERCFEDQKQELGLDCYEVGRRQGTVLDRQKTHPRMRNGSKETEGGNVNGFHILVGHAVSILLR